MRDTFIEKDSLFLKNTISDLTESIDQLCMLQDLSNQFFYKFDFNRIIDNFLDIVKEIINYNTCILYLYNDSFNSYQIAETRGVSIEEQESIDLEDKIINWVLTERRWTEISFLEYI